MWFISNAAERVSCNCRLASIGHWTDQLPGAVLQPKPKFMPAFRRKKMLKRLKPREPSYFSMRLKAAWTDCAELSRKDWRDPGRHWGVVFSAGLQSVLPSMATILTQPYRLCFPAQPQSSDSQLAAQSHRVTTKGQLLVFVYSSENADTDIC